MVMGEYGSVGERDLHLDYELLEVLDAEGVDRDVGEDGEDVLFGGLVADALGE
jgi:hypothetical protein